MQILSDVDLTSWHTLRAPAQAHQLTIIEAVEELTALGRDDFILGSGSNVIFVGEVSRPLAHLRLYGRGQVAEDTKYIDYYAAAGEKWDDIAQETSEAGWFGLENLALIPGTVGAAPVQNIGAYGVEVAQVIAKVHVFDRQRQSERAWSAQDCGFAYRQSHFKGAWRNRFVITGVTFRLQKNACPVLSYPELANALPQNQLTPLAVYDQVCAIRQHKLPDPAVLPNAGSFFHNPIVANAQAEALLADYPKMPQYRLDTEHTKLSAGWCIEQCGFKGDSDGAVGMYAGHALVLINQGGTGADILAYAAKVQAAVKSRFGVSLQIEPTIIGDLYDRN